MSRYTIHRSAADQWNSPRMRLDESSRLFHYGPLVPLPEESLFSRLRMAIRV